MKRANFRRRQVRETVGGAPIREVSGVPAKRELEFASPRPHRRPPRNQKRNSTDTAVLASRRTDEEMRQDLRMLSLLPLSVQSPSLDAGCLGWRLAVVGGLFMDMT
jgi:hypothetical protein